MANGKTKKKDYYKETLVQTVSPSVQLLPEVSESLSSISQPVPVILKRILCAALIFSIGSIDPNSIGVPEQATAISDKCTSSFLTMAFGMPNLLIDPLLSPQQESMPPKDYGGIEMETGTEGSQYALDMNRNLSLALPLSSGSFMHPDKLEPHMPGLNNSDSLPAERSGSPCTTDRQYLAVTPMTPMEEQESLVHGRIRHQLGPLPQAKIGKPEVQCDRSRGERVTMQYKLPSYYKTKKEDGGCYYKESLVQTVSPSVQLLPEVSESLSSISQLGHFNTTPRPTFFKHTLCAALIFSTFSIDPNSIGVPEQATASSDKCTSSFLTMALGMLNLLIDPLLSPQPESMPPKDYGGTEMETATDGFQDAPDNCRNGTPPLRLSCESLMSPVNPLNLEPHIPDLNSGDSMPAEMLVSPCTTDRQYLDVTPMTPMQEQGNPSPAKTDKPEVQCDSSIGERVTVQDKLPSYCKIKKEDGGCCYCMESSPLPVQEVVHPLDSRYLTCNPSNGEYHKCRNYFFQGKIGDGGQGTCFYATDRMLEKTFAYKENYRPEDATKLLAECAMMSQITHDNVVAFLGAVREDMSKVKLFMEFAECGSVHHVFSNYAHLQTNTPFIAHLLQQLLSAVNHLHQNNILHRDIKGKNLLLFDGCVCKLADFGMAERLDNHERLPDNTVKGTCPFLSPEYMREQVYRSSTDVWSSMAVAVEMMTGKDPWSAVNQDALVLIIGNYRAQDHFHQLVPQQELEQRVKEAEQAEDRDLVMWNFRELVGMMKKVFVEEHVRRPTAQDLLCEDVMLKAPKIYDNEGEDEAHTSPKHSTT